MARTIANIVADIRSAVLGRDVRTAIADGIETCYSDVTSSKTKADTAATSANSAASRATTAATNAENVVTKYNSAISTGTDLKSVIATYVSTANTYRNNANTYMSNAHTYMSNAYTYRNNANTYASNASSSASTAQSHANNANTYMSNAYTYRNNANTYASNASGSASTAQSYADNANTYMLNTYNYMGSANTYALAAKDYASDLSDGIDNVTAKYDDIVSMYDNMETYADIAYGYMDSAYDYAESASSSAVAASDYALRATTAAANAASEVEARLDFDTRQAYIQHYSDMASAAAERAENATQGLDEAIANAQIATTSANDAADNATEATSGFLTLQQSLSNLRDALELTYIPNVTSATTRANTATTNATTAAQQASTAANSAQELIDDMDSAVSEWLSRRDAIDASIAEMAEATSSAESASESIEGMTVTYTSVDSYTPSSVVVTDVDGHKNLHFNISKGEQGDSNIIKGHAYASLSDLESDITDPDVGDLYNVGSDPVYNVYRWTGSEWEDQGLFGINIRDITNTMIDNVYDGTPVGDKANRYLDFDGLDYLVNEKIAAALSTKVDAVSGKVLSTNDFTDSYKSQIDTNRASITVLSNNKVDKLSGKGLSSNDFTTAYKNQIDTNKNNITSLNDGKLDNDFSMFINAPVGSVQNGLFSLQYDDSMYKATGSRIVQDFIEIGSLLTAYNIATVAETTDYLGI